MHLERDIFPILVFVMALCAFIKRLIMIVTERLPEEMKRVLLRFITYKHGL